MRQPVRFPVITQTLCHNCPHIGGQGVILGDSMDFVDCRRRNCDNHRSAQPQPPALPDVPPFALPAPDSTVALGQEKT